MLSLDVSISISTCPALEPPTVRPWPQPAAALPGQEYQGSATFLCGPCAPKACEFKGHREQPPGPETQAELHYPQSPGLAQKEMSFMQGTAPLS